MLNPTPLGRKEAGLKNPLSLAFVGDTVWDLLVRQDLLHSQAHAGVLHHAASARVNAAAQAKAAQMLEPFLNEEEHAVFRRGCNAHSRHNPPKNQDPRDYSRATGLETLVGYLYLTAQEDRLMELYRLCCEKLFEEEEQCRKK